MNAGRFTVVKDTTTGNRLLLVDQGGLVPESVAVFRNQHQAWSVAAALNEADLTAYDQGEPF